MTEVRDLGVIEGHEVPGSSGSAAGPPSPPPPPPPPPPSSSSPPPPAAPSSPPPTAPPTGAPVPPGALPVPARRGAVEAARAETAQAFRDIREAHRRGPKPNTRPLPRWVRRLAWVLDDAVPVPGTNGRRVGVDGFLTLVPGIGDAAGLALSMVVVLAGVAAGVSLPTLLRMMLNVGFESIVGLVPFGGALFDMAYKANDRNVRLIERDLADRRGTRRSSLAVLALLLLTLFLGFLMLVFFTVAGLALLVWFVSRVL